MASGYQGNQPPVVRAAWGNNRPEQLMQTAGPADYATHVQHGVRQRPREDVRQSGELMERRRRKEEEEAMRVAEQKARAAAKLQELGQRTAAKTTAGGNQSGDGEQPAAQRVFIVLNRPSSQQKVEASVSGEVGGAAKEEKVEHARKRRRADSDDIDESTAIVTKPTDQRRRGRASFKRMGETDPRLWHPPEQQVRQPQPPLYTIMARNRSTSEGSEKDGDQRSDRHDPQERLKEHDGQEKSGRQEQLQKPDRTDRQGRVGRESKWGNRREKGEHDGRRRHDRHDWSTVTEQSKVDKEINEDKKEKREVDRKLDERRKESDDRGKRNVSRKASEGREGNGQTWTNRRELEREDRRMPDDDRQGRKHGPKEAKWKGRPIDERLEYSEKKGDKFERDGQRVHQRGSSSKESEPTGRHQNSSSYESETTNKWQNERTRERTDIRPNDRRGHDSEARVQRPNSRRQNERRDRGRDRKESGRNTTDRGSRESERRREGSVREATGLDRTQSELSGRREAKTLETHKKETSSDPPQKTEDTVSDKDGSKGEVSEMSKERARSHSNPSTNAVKGRGRGRGADRRPIKQSDSKEFRQPGDYRPTRQTSYGDQDDYDYGHDNYYYYGRKPRRERGGGAARRGARGTATGKAVDRSSVKSQNAEDKHKDVERDKVTKPVNVGALSELTTPAEGVASGTIVDNDSRSSVYSTPRGSPPRADDAFFDSSVHETVTETAKAVTVADKQSDAVSQRLETKVDILEAKDRPGAIAGSQTTQFQKDKPLGGWSVGRGRGRGRGVVDRTVSDDGERKRIGRGQPTVKVNSAKKFSSQRPGVTKNGWTKAPSKRGTEQTAKVSASVRGKKTESGIKQGEEKDNEKPQRQPQQPYGSSKQKTSSQGVSDGEGRVSSAKSSTAGHGSRGRPADASGASQHKQQQSNSHEQKAEVVTKKSDIQKRDVISTLDLTSAGVWVIDNAPDHSDTRHQSVSSEEGFTEVKSRSTELKEKREESKRQEAERQRLEEQKLALSKLPSTTRTSGKQKIIGPRFTKGMPVRGSPPTAAASTSSSLTGVQDGTDSRGKGKKADVAAKSQPVSSAAPGSRSSTTSASKLQTETATHWSVSGENQPEGSQASESSGKYMSPLLSGIDLVSFNVPLSAIPGLPASSHGGYGLQPIAEGSGCMTASNRPQQPIARPKTTPVQQDSASQGLQRGEQQSTPRIAETEQREKGRDISRVMESSPSLTKGERSAQELVKQQPDVYLSDSVVSTSGILSSQAAQKSSEDEVTSKVKQAKYLWNEKKEEQQVASLKSEVKSNSDKEADDHLESGLEKMLADSEDVTEPIVKDNSPIVSTSKPLPPPPPPAAVGVSLSQSGIPVEMVEMSNVNHMAPMITIRPHEYPLHSGRGYHEPARNIGRQLQRSNQSRAAYVQTTYPHQMHPRHGMPSHISPSVGFAHHHHQVSGGQQPLMQPQANMPPYHTMQPPPAMVQPMPHQQGYGPHPLPSDFTYFSERLPPGATHRLAHLSSHHPQPVGSVPIMPHAVGPHGQMMSEPPQAISYGYQGLSAREIHQAKQVALKRGSEVRHDIMVNQDHRIAPPTNMPDLPESVVNAAVDYHQSGDFYRRNNEYGQRQLYGNMGGEHRLRHRRSRHHEAPAGTGSGGVLSQSQKRDVNSPQVESQENGSTTAKVEEQEARTE